MSTHVFTVGHSNHTVDHFIEMLQSHQVSVIADVRSVPYSRFAVQFNKDPLRQALAEAGIHYVFLGNELGARSKDPNCYEHGRVIYDRLAQTDLFLSGLSRLSQGIESESVAIMCTEKDPLDCHRTLLVARALVERHFTVDHILAVGKAESYEDSLLRLLNKSKRAQPELSTSEEELIDLAMKAQEERIAFVDKELEQASDGTAS